MKLFSEQSIFNNRTFCTVWAGQTVSFLGDILFNLGLMWWVVSVTGSGAAMSASALSTALPRIFLGPIAGVLADRYDRRTLMIITNVVSATVTAAMAVLFLNGIFSLPIVLISAAIIGFLATVHAPTFDATIPSIVQKDELVRVNSLMQSSRSLAGIVAPALSGVILALFGVGASIVINSVTFLVAAFSLLLVRLPSPKVVATRTSLLRQSMFGFSFIRQHELLFPMILFLAVINLSLAPLGIALPILVVKVLQAGPAVYGMYGSGQGLGVLLGSSLLSAFPRVANRVGLMLVAALIGLGGSIMLIGMATGAAVLIVAGFLLGLFVVLAQISAQCIFQRETPDDVRGRVFAARNTLGIALQPLGMAAAGPLVDLVGPSTLLLGAGIMCAATGTLGFLVSGLTKYSNEREEASIIPATRVVG